MRNVLTFILLLNITLYSRTSLARTRRECQNVFELSEVRATDWHRGPVISEREKSDSDPGQFHYALIADAQNHGPLL